MQLYTTEKYENAKYKQEKIKVKVRKTIVMQSHSATKNCLHLAFHITAPNKH